MRIIDNILHKVDFSLLQKEIMSTTFPWYFAPTATVNDTNFSWVHVVYSSEIEPSPVYKTVETAILRILKKVNEPLNKLIRIRLGLQTVTASNVVNMPHIDAGIPHKVGLFYLTTTDGTTKLYNELFDFNSSFTAQQYLENVLNSTVTVMAECDPIENRLLLFNGAHYHASTSPTQGIRRITLNFNYF